MAVLAYCDDKVVSIAIPVTTHAYGAGFSVGKGSVHVQSLRRPMVRNAGSGLFHGESRTICRLIHGAHVVQQRVIKSAKYLAASLTANGIVLGQSGLKCGIQPSSKITLRPEVYDTCTVTRLYAMYKNKFGAWQLLCRLCAGTSISLTVQNNPVHEEASAVLYSWVGGSLPPIVALRLGGHRHPNILVRLVRSCCLPTALVCG